MDTGPSGSGPQAIPDDPWRRFPPAYTWQKLVIPTRERNALKAIAAEMLQQRSENGDWGQEAHGPVLFSGPAGTGKTMAAQIIGAQLGVSILEVDTPSLRARDRPGLDQLIERAFTTAAAEHAVLVFDHADAVLAKPPSRRPNQPRPGVLTAPDLLERAERHPGLVIFASTVMGGIDQASLARFRSVTEFPFPDAAARARIWRGLLPRRARVAKADIEQLASSFKLPGAAIASCCRAAIAAAHAQRVPVTLIHVAEAVQSEYRGRLASDSTLAAVVALVARARSADPGHGPEPAPADPASSPAPARASRPNGMPAAEGDIRVRRRRAAERRTTRPAEGPAGTDAPEYTAASTAFAETLARGRGRGAKPPGTRASRLPAGRQSWFAPLAAGATLVAAAMGFGVAQLAAGAEPATAKRAAAGPVRVTVPAGWSRQPIGGGRGLGLTNELALGPGSRRPVLIIGTLPTNASGLLPQTLLPGQSVPPPQITTLGQLSFYRYTNVVPLGQRAAASVYTTPTTSGTLIGICTASSAASRASSQCERVLSTVRLTSGRVLGTAGSISYAAQLNTVMAKLNAARTQIGAQLASARTASIQAQSASQLAAAHASAATSLRALSPGPAAAAANSQLVAALQASAAAYVALAQAAQRSDAQGFASARASVASATAAMSSAFTQLSALGYHIG